MDFSFTTEEQEFREEVREFLDRELTPEILQEHEERGLPGLLYYRQFTPKLAARGWLGLGWPREYGGGGSIWKQFILVEEVAYRGIAFRNQGVSIVGPSILTYGTEEQKAEFLTRIGRGELIFCALLSEPQAGSDSANVQTRAQRDGDYYRIDGDKIFASEADLADYGVLTARTDPATPKHRGVSMFLMDLKAPGVEVHPWTTLAGDRRFNQVFLTDVRLHRRYLVGQENRGWYQLMTFFEFERAAFMPAEFVGTVRRALDDLKEYVQDTTASGQPLAQNPLVRQRLAQRTVELEVLRMLAYRPASLWARGQRPTYEAPMVKGFGSELTQRVAHTALETLGLAGILDRGSAGAPLEGKMVRHYLRTLSDTIRGGTSEIQRTQIAVRGLGLPTVR